MYDHDKEKLINVHYGIKIMLKYFGMKTTDLF